MSIAISGSSITFPDQTQMSTAAGGSFRNRIINGDMRIDQRNAGVAVTPSATTYLVDRFEYSGSQASKFTWQQNKGSVTPPVGFVNYLGGSVAAAVAIGAADYFALVQKIEGFNIADLGWGTANAKTITLSFRVYSSLTGTFGGSLTNSSNNRTYPFTYSIPTANTWTTVSITIAGDTSGTWLTTNGSGIGVQFGLGVGATYSGTAGAWAGVQYISATGAVSVVGTVGATFYITGVQLEQGSTATEFERRPIGTELALCQRYCYAITQRGVGSAINSSYLYNNSLSFPVTMRAAPTMSNASYIVSGGSSGTPALIGAGAGGTNQDAAGIYNSAANWAATSPAVSLTAIFSSEL